MAARFLVLQHDGENFFGRKISGVVKQGGGFRLEDARNKARPHLRTAGIAAGGIECESANRLAGAHDIGDHRDHRCRHLGEIDARIGERRIERNRRLADVDNAHLRFCASQSSCAGLTRASRLGSHGV